MQVTLLPVQVLAQSCISLAHSRKLGTHCVTESTVGKRESNKAHLQPSFVHFRTCFSLSFTLPTFDGQYPYQKLGQNQISLCSSYPTDHALSNELGISDITHEKVTGCYTQDPQLCHTYP